MKRFRPTSATLVLMLATVAGCSPESASVPDLSGVWARNSVDFERPASGPGPIENISRLPDGSRNVDMPVGDYNNPVLRPEAAEILRRRGEISLSGANYPSPSNQCWPSAPPFILNHMQIQIVQAPDQVIILYALDHHVRSVYLNVPHQQDTPRSWYGESVGRYQGDTLVIDTIGVKVGPLSMADDYGTPHTEALHVIERYRLIDGDVAKEAIERHEKENGSVPPDAEGITVDDAYTGSGPRNRW